MKRQWGGQGRKKKKKKETEDIHNKRKGESIAGEDVMMKSFSVSVSDETQTDINKELTVWGKTES